MVPLDFTGFIPGLFAFVAFAILGCCALMVTNHHRASLDAQIRLFLTALAVRYLASIAIYQFGLVNVLKDEDGSAWILGVGYNIQWQQQNIGLFELPGKLLEAYNFHHQGYYYLLGTLFYFVDYGRLPVAAMNGFFGSLTIVYAYRIAETLFSTSVAKRVGLWLCFFPSMIIWSSQTIKEPVVIFLEVLGIYSCIRIRRDGFSFGYLAFAIVCVVLMIPFRFYAAYVTIAAMILPSLIPKAGEGKNNAGPFAAVLVIGIFILSSGVLASKSASTDKFDLKFVENYRKALGSGRGDGGGSSVSVDVDIRTPAGMSVALTVGALHLLLAPFPWQLGSGGLRTLMVFPEQLFWWWLFYVGVIPGFRQTVKTRFFDILPLLVFLCGFGMLYSILFGNVGLAYRQRAQLLPGLIIFGAAGLEFRKSGRAHGLGHPSDEHYPGFANWPPNNPRAFARPGRPPMVPGDSIGYPTATDPSLADVHQGIHEPWHPPPMS